MNLEDDWKKRRKSARTNRDFAMTLRASSSTVEHVQFERLPPAYQLAPKIVFRSRLVHIAKCLSHTHSLSLSLSLARSLAFVEYDIYLPRKSFSRTAAGRHRTAVAYHKEKLSIHTFVVFFLFFHLMGTHRG